MAQDLFSPPAAVRPVEDLGELAAEINREHEAGEDAARQGLEHYRKAGEALLRAKAQCGHGRWLPWLEKSVRFSHETARRYMRLAESPEGKLQPGCNLKDAVAVLAADEASPTVEEWRNAWREAGVWFPAATVPELRAWLSDAWPGVADEIADDDDGYRLLVDTLAGPAASYHTQAGKRLPGPPRPPTAINRREIVRADNWLAYWDILVVYKEALFLRWCDSVGITRDKKGFRMPEEPNAEAIRATLLAEFKPGEDGNPTEDVKVFVAGLSDEDLVKWVHGGATAFFFQWDGWQDTHATTGYLATYKSARKANPKKVQEVTECSPAG
jgi:hypothetical protein